MPYKFLIIFYTVQKSYVFLIFIIGTVPLYRYISFCSYRKIANTGMYRIHSQVQSYRKN